MLNNAFAVGLRTLAANPLRTFLSTLGVIIGTAALVAVLALGDGVEQYARRQIATQTDLQQFTVRAVPDHRVDGLWLPRPDTVRLDPAALAALQAELGPDVTLTLRRSGATLVTGIAGDSGRGARLEALAGREAVTPDSTVRAGRGLTATEAIGAESIAVISPDLAALVAPDAEALGRVIKLNGSPFTVIGVAGRPGEGDKRLAIQVPFGAYASAVPATMQQPTGILGLTATVEEMPDVVARTEAWARRTGGDGLAVGSRGDMLVEMRKGMLVAKLFMGSITGISLLVGGIGIMNVLLAAVIERTREIGIRRATGAQRRDIVAQFLAESVVITGAGSLLGLLVGMSGAFGVSWLMRAQTDAPVHAAFTPLPIVVAAASATIIGLVFGLYPALKASRLSPIDAIRTE